MVIHKTGIYKRTWDPGPLKSRYYDQGSYIFRPQAKKQWPDGTRIPE